MRGTGRTPTRLLGRRARQRRYAAEKRRAATGTTFARRPRRRGGIGGMVGRMRERARTARARQQAADAERAAAEALAITEAERLARESVTGRPEVTNGAPWPPTVTDRNGPTWGRPPRPCGPVPNRQPGWVCRKGRWVNLLRKPDIHPRPRVPDAGIAIACSPPTAPSPGMRCIGGRWYGPAGEPEGTEVPKAPTARPWWMGRAPDGEIPLRDTSGIPTPPGLPGGPSMRPPPSGPEDTATERVPTEAPAAPGLDVAKLLPLAAAAAFMFMRK